MDQQRGWRDGGGWGVGGEEQQGLKSLQTLLLTKVEVVCLFRNKKQNRTITP